VVAKSVAFVEMTARFENDFGESRAISMSIELDYLNGSMNNNSGK
jgi:hypothetical protein